MSWYVLSSTKKEIEGQCVKGTVMAIVELDGLN